jgi:hypothetical protein
MKSNLFCVFLALCLASSLATDYTFASTAGGSWKTSSNWNPQGVPGVDDNGKQDRPTNNRIYEVNLPFFFIVLFTYLDYDDEIVVTLDGDITVNSLTMDTHGFQLKSGTITIQNEGLINAAIFYRINVTINGNTRYINRVHILVQEFLKKNIVCPRFESTGSGGVDGILCDSCIINVKKSLVFATKTSGNTEFANDAMVITYAGANTTLFYGSIHSAVTQVGTLVNYGTLLFGSSFGYGNSPWGNPPVTETGPFAEIKNYGT